jgi:hypothetical protein
MSITIEWKVNDVESVIADGGVTNVKLSCSASGEAGEYAVNGGESVLNPDATASGFISFEDLTESVVIDWAKDSLGTEEVASIEEVLTAKVTAQMTPVTQTGLPWSI